MVTSITEKKYTIDDLLAKEADGKHYELIDGEIVEKEMGPFKHSRLGAWLITELGLFIRAHNLSGYVTGSDATYQLDEDNARLPDVTYLSASSIAEMPKHAIYGTFAPDLAIEIKSPNNTHRALRAKALRYLAAKSRLVWVVDPENEVVQVYRPDQVAIKLAKGIHWKAMTCCRD